LLAGNFSPSQYLNLDYSGDDRKGRYREDVGNPLLCEGDNQQESDRESDCSQEECGCGEEESDREEEESVDPLLCDGDYREESGKAMEGKLQPCLFVNPKDLHYSTECLGAEPPKQDNLTDRPRLGKAPSPALLSSMSKGGGGKTPHSEGEEEDGSNPRIVAGTQRDASDGEEEVNHTVVVQSNEPIPIPIDDEEEAPPDSSDDEDADPKIATQSKEPLAGASGGEDDYLSESDFTAVDCGQPADGLGSKNALSDSDTMAVDEDQRMDGVDFKKSLDGPATGIEEDDLTAKDVSKKLLDTARVEEDDPMRGDEPKKPSDGGDGSDNEEDDLMAKDVSKKLLDGLIACVEEDDPMRDDEPKKPSDDGDSSDDEFKKPSDGEDSSDDESKKLSGGEGEFDNESKKSSDGEDDPMNVDESLQHTALFEPRRSSRIAPMKKNNPTIRIILPRPRKSSKTKRKPALKKGEVLLRVGVQIIPRRKG